MRVTMGETSCVPNRRARKPRFDPERSLVVRDGERGLYQFVAPDREVALLAHRELLIELLEVLVSLRFRKQAVERDTVDPSFSCGETA